MNITGHSGISIMFACGHKGTIEILSGHNGTMNKRERTSRSVVSACGHNGTIEILCGHNGTADTTGRTNRSVVSTCGHNGTIKFVCGHNGTADTTGRNTPPPPPKKSLKDTNGRDMSTRTSFCLYNQTMTWIFTRSGLSSLSDSDYKVIPSLKIII